ncbi:MAG: type II toxin-antitoxin system RelE/ParE family toxin [Chitinophagaceae bacterium]|nr:type II toxin-antitoxin system RelE/ParE family toxin [Chitinophagaceae bacterium]
MRFILHIQEEAQQDIQDAFDWYEEQRTGLGERFLEELYPLLKTIAANPQYYGFVFAGFRDAALKKFPYLVTYRIEGKHVFVNSVRHTRRRSTNT